MFSFKKCSLEECCIPHICSAKHLANDMFSTLHHLPFLMKKLGDEKFKHFDEVYGEITSEGNRPGLIEKVKSSHHMPFSPSSQSANNTGTVVQCDECGKWRCVYSKRKLKKDVFSLLERFNEEFNYTCWVVLQELIFKNMTPNTQKSKNSCL